LPSSSAGTDEIRAAEARARKRRDRPLLVETLVVADLAEQVGHRCERAVVGREVGVERSGLPFRVLGHEVHVLVLGVVFEVGVQAIRPVGPQDEQQPRDVVVDQGDRLWDPEVVDAVLVLAGIGDALLEDQQVPLLVVLLLPRLPDAVVDPPGQPSPPVHVRDRDVGDLLPGLIRNPGDQLEDLELRQRPLLAVERVEGGEQDARQHAVLPARRVERLGLCPNELVVTQERRTSRHLGAGHISGSIIISTLHHWTPASASPTPRGVPILGGDRSRWGGSFSGSSAAQPGDDLLREEPVRCRHQFRVRVA
jgi:hypothetical protein